MAWRDVTIIKVYMLGLPQKNPHAFLYGWTIPLMRPISSSSSITVKCVCSEYTHVHILRHCVGLLFGASSGSSTSAACVKRTKNTHYFTKSHQPIPSPVPTSGLFLHQSLAPTRPPHVCVSNPARFPAILLLRLILDEGKSSVHIC